MFKKLVPYSQGQELALKYLWCVLQVTSKVAHDAFLILYSHLDDTDWGEKSIHQYCMENNRLFVYEELIEDGYTKELFEVSPKKAEYFDLKVTRTLTELLIANKFEGSSMFKVTRNMKDFNYMRNDLCHLELKSMGERDFKMKLQGLWEKLKILYRSACELTGTKFSSHTTKDLDSTLSSLLSSVDTKDSKYGVCKGRNKIREGSRIRGTSQSSEDSGYFEPNKPVKPSTGEAFGSPKKTSTKGNTKEKWVQTKPPRKSALKNAFTQVEIKEIGGLKAEEKNISKKVPVPRKNETVNNVGIPAVSSREEAKPSIAPVVRNSYPEDKYLSKNYNTPSAYTVNQAKPSKDVHKNMTSTVHKHIPSTSSNLGEINSHKCLTKDTLLYKELNKPSTSGDKESGVNCSLQFCGGPPCYAEDSLKTQSNSSVGSDEERIRREQMNFPQHGTNNSKDTITTIASGMGSGSNCASFKHSDAYSEPSANSTCSTTFTSRKVNGSNKCSFSKCGKDAKPKGEATTNDQHKCTCSAGSASYEDSTDVSTVQVLYILTVSFVMFCFKVLVVCMYDLVDRVKRECRLRWLNNSTRLIINANTGLGQLAQVVHIQGECLVLKFLPVIHVIPGMLHDCHHHHRTPNFPGPKRFDQRHR